MRQNFPRWTNVVAKIGLLCLVLLIAMAIWGSLIYTRSSYGSGVGVRPVQPVPFSHEHHAGKLGIDCRYCHGSVESSSFAGIPSTETCMNCHSQIWVGSEMLEPVRESYRTGESLIWKRVNNVPGFVYFNHSIHVYKGVGCSSCHGQVEQMPFTFQTESLLMEWCLDCHRHPEQHLRPIEDIFDMNYQPPENQTALGRKLMKEYSIRNTNYLTSCSVCHR